MPLNALKENRLTEADRSSTFGTKVPRQQVATITFLDSIKDAPASSVDASQLGNGRVKAWAVEQNSNPSDSLSGTLYDLYIAADGGVCAPVDSWCLFELMTNLKSISFGNAFYTDYTTNMDAMFQNCHSLTELDLSNFNTENVEKMLFMFNECNALKKLDLSSFDTSKVTDTACMFQNCNALIDLDLRNFDTSNVNNMQYMFFGCYNLTSLAVSSFNTSKVTKMDCMFLDCRSLASLDVSSFNTSKVTNMDGMFYGCNKLTDFHCYDNRIMKAYLNR